MVALFQEVTEPLGDTALLEKVHLGADLGAYSTAHFAFYTLCLLLRCDLLAFCSHHNACSLPP